MPSPLAQNLLFIEAAWKSDSTCTHDLTTTVKSRQETGRAWLVHLSICHAVPSVLGMSVMFYDKEHWSIDLES